VYFEPAPYTKRPDPETLAECKRLLFEASRAWDIPPCHITSHIRTKPAVEARRWLMAQMFDLGLKRNQVAWAFGLSLRRVRRSEIGGPASPHGKRGGDKFRKVDLLGYPLVVEAAAPEEKP